MPDIVKEAQAEHEKSLERKNDGKAVTAQPADGGDGEGKQD